MLEEVFRDEWGRVLASLVRFLGDFDKAEEAAQEAFAISAERYFHSTRGEFLRRLGRDTEARAAYRRALELASSTPERRFLTRRLEQL